MHGPLKKSTRPPCRLSEAQDHPTHSCCICLQAGFTCVCEMSLLFMSRVEFGWQQSALVMRQRLHLDDDNPRRPDSFTVACVIERCCEFETDTMLQVWINWLLCCCYAAIVLWDNMSVMICTCWQTDCAAKSRNESHNSHRSYHRFTVVTAHFCICHHPARVCCCMSSRHRSYTRQPRQEHQPWRRCLTPPHQPEHLPNLGSPGHQGAGGGALSGGPQGSPEAKRAPETQLK